MTDIEPTVVTEAYDLDMNLTGLYCSYNTGNDQMEYACLFKPGLAELGVWPAGLAPSFAPVPSLPPAAFIVKHDFPKTGPTWREFADWAVDALVKSTPNTRKEILAHVVWGKGLWQATDRRKDAHRLIADERTLDGKKLDRSGYLKRLRFGEPIAGVYTEAPTQMTLPYNIRVYQMKGTANTQPLTGFVYYGNNWQPQTLKDFLGDGSPQSWNLLQVADWQVQREYPEATD